MPKLLLADGREVPFIKPHVGDQIDLERELRRADKKYGPKQFQEDLGITTFQTAFILYASFHRAGVPTSWAEVLELDLEELGNILKLDPGEGIDAMPDDDEDESEGEQGTDPQLARTGDAAGGVETVTTPGLSAID